MTWPDSLSAVPQNEPLAEVTVDELARRLDGGDGEGIIVIDVRQPDEYGAGHVHSARLVPLAEVPDHIDELRAAAMSAAAPLHVMCRSGARSAMAGEFLLEQGVPAVNVAGGILAWVEAGHGVVTGDQPT